MFYLTHGFLICHSSDALDDYKCRQICSSDAAGSASLYLFIISELCEEKTVALIYPLSENQSVNLVEMVKLFGCCDTLKQRHL